MKKNLKPTEGYNSTGHSSTDLTKEQREIGESIFFVHKKMSQIFQTYGIVDRKVIYRSCYTKKGLEKLRELRQTLIEVMIQL